jgi:gamma-glutamyltranspeptidase/glutathione hydrolase
MSPTFIDTPQHSYVLGTPGGSRIISMVSGAALSVLHNPNAGIVDAVAKGRIHHQYLPDTLFFEPGALNEKEQKALKNKGHHLEEVSGRYGNMQMIHWNKVTGKVEAAADPRGEGTAAVH